MRYASRPGLAPAVAILIARGDIRKDDVILDVGCGTGTDCVLLARWGFLHVIGIDPDEGAIGIARAKATRLGLKRRVQFLVGRPEDLPAHLADSAVDVALHTLVANNLEEGEHAHFRAVARALKPKGLLVVSMRVFGNEGRRRPGSVAPVAGMRRYFDLTPAVSSHLAESSRYYPGHAPVAVWLGRPRRRRTTRAAPRKR